MEAKSATEAPIWPERAVTKLAVDEIRSALHEILLDHVGLFSGQAICRDRRIELLLCRIDHCLNETVDGFPFFLRDSRERLSVAELLAQLISGQSEIGRCGVQPGELTHVPGSSIVAVEPAEAAEEERRISGLDPRFELRALFLGEPAGSDRLLNAVLQALLERFLERARLDAELRRSVVDDRLALAARPEHARRGDRGRCAESDREHEHYGRAGGECWPSAFFHSEDVTRDV